MFGLTAEQWDALSAIGTLVSAALALAVVVLTLVSVRHNGRMVQEMEKQRLAQSNPLILLAFDQQEVANGSDIVILVENYGGPAAQVRFSFRTPMLNSQRTDISQDPLLAGTLPIMRPGEQQPIRFDDFAAFFGPKYYLGEVKSSFKATIHSSDPSNGRSFEPSHMDLDLNHLAPVKPRGQAIHLAELASGPGWRRDSPPSSEEQAVYEGIRTKLMGWGVNRDVIAEWQAPNAIRPEFRRRGWWVSEFDGPHYNPRLVAVKQAGDWQGTVVSARGWDYRVVLVLALHKALEIDLQYVSR
jgi:hypothetical protein